MPLDLPLYQEGSHYRSPLRWRKQLAFSGGTLALVILASVTFGVAPPGLPSWSGSLGGPASLGWPDPPAVWATTAPALPAPALPASGAPTAPASSAAPVASEFPAATATLAAEPKGRATAAMPANLQNKIDRILKGAKGYRVGVALTAVAGGETRTYGDASAFVAASTAKLITAAAYYHLVETGKTTMEQELGSYSAGFQIRSMINTSNNDSWLLLMNAVGFPDLIQYAASIGITYDPQQNRLTPAEMAVFLKQLYAGELLNPENTKQLLSYMQNTNVEAFIPAATRPDITVHHKYGQVYGNLHDVALLSFHDTTYALVIYTESADSRDQARRIRMIHSLTKTIVEALFPSPAPSP